MGQSQNKPFTLGNLRLAGISEQSAGTKPVATQDKAPEQKVEQSIDDRQADKVRDRDRDREGDRDRDRDRRQRQRQRQENLQNALFGIV